MGAGGDRGLWAVMIALLLAVLVPTACVLWFMTAAMRNERLAVRQRLSDLYRQRALDARSSLEAHWSQKTAALDADPDLSPARRFAKLIRGEVAHSVIVYDETGEVAYPASPRPAPDRRSETPEWSEARGLEHGQGRADEAAELYAKIAERAEDVDSRALALRAQARCLARSGRKEQALQILTGPLAEESMSGAMDADGRLLAPNALLYALELLVENPDLRFRPNEALVRDLNEHYATVGELADGGGRRDFLALVAHLIGRANDYDDSQMSSDQRRFLMRSLREIGGGRSLGLTTLRGEELAEEYLEAPDQSPEAMRLTRARSAGMWHVSSRDGRTVAVFSEEELLDEMISATGIGEPFAGATFRLVPPGADGGSADAFLAAPVGGVLGGWQLQVRIVGENPFAAAGKRQRTVYLWTGALVILVAGLLSVTAAAYVRRQIKLTRLKNDLIATVSHELKTPLASMRVLVDTLREGRCKDEGQAQEYFELIARENLRLSRLIDNFLTFSRMERNKRTFEFVQLRPGEIVRGAVDSARERFARPGCRLDVDISDDLPPVIGDRDALITVLLNLLDNAYKYSGDSKLVTVRACEAGGDVCFEVTDNGIGMSRRAARKVFARFYRVDQSLSRGTEGCGLGLSIVKFIVDAHGGSVRVTTRPDEGSTFTVRLPAHRPSPARSQKGGSPRP